MGLRAADLEVLFTANVDEVEKAEKQVKQTGERIEKNPLKLDADAKGALAGMDRVEAQAKKLVSADTMLKLDAEVDKAEKSIGRTKQRLEELQVKALAGLDVKAETGRAEAQLSKAERSLAKLVDARNSIELDADASAALAALGKVSSATERLVSRDVLVKVDTEIDFAQKKVTRLEADLEVLKSKKPTVQVLADTAKAEAGLKDARGRLEDLNSARAVMVIDADAGPAVEGFDQAGEDSGNAFGVSAIAALASIPIAGAVIGLGAAAGKALVDEFQAALQIEVRQDRLQALTGIDEASALRLGRVAGEAYTRNFGESIEANMDTARLALQFDIIDADSSVRDSQRVIEGLSGIANALDEEVRPTATAVTTLLQSGMATSAQQAFDILATGAREGVNRVDDLLDTMTEYPVVLTKLGITGDEMLGLLNQGLKAGARNSDVAADALKEFQIRATDGSVSSAKGFERLGLSASEMSAKIAAGGAGAREGLDEVLDGLRSMTDPVERNAAAVELFGTKAEDMGDALFAMDLSTAVAQLNGVEGAAQRMFDTLSDNDASSMEEAKRNIEVAAESIKGALAGTFGEPLGEFADWVSANRGPVTEFLFEIADGAIEFGIALLNSAADGSEALGELISGPIAALVEAVGIFQGITAPFSDWQSTVDLAGEMRGFKDTTSESADIIRGQWIPALEGAQDKVAEFGNGAIAMGELNDASRSLAKSIEDIGYAADGSTQLVDGYTVAQDGAVTASENLEQQIQNSITALNDELNAAAAAGDGQQALTDRYNAGTDAMVGQLVQMGMTEAQAIALVEAYNTVPGEKTTNVSSNAVERKVDVDNFTGSVRSIPGSKDVAITVSGNGISLIREANAELAKLGNKNISISGTGGVYGLAQGGVLEFMAQGGVRGTPMQNIAQMVSPNTWRVVGDRGDVPEAYVPLDGSARSWGILAEALSRMPGNRPQLMADGGIVGGAGVYGARGGPMEIKIYGHSGMGVDELIERVRPVVREEIERML